MDRYFVTHCSVNGKAYRFGAIAADPVEAERKAAQAAYNYYNIQLAGVPVYTEEITEKEYNEL